jgi:hypothetical protein
VKDVRLLRLGKLDREPTVRATSRWSGSWPWRGLDMRRCSSARRWPNERASSAETAMFFNRELSWLAFSNVCSRKRRLKVPSRAREFAAITASNPTSSLWCASPD